jgi:hypothetical protein
MDLGLLNLVLYSKSLQLLVRVCAALLACSQVKDDLLK